MKGFNRFENALALIIAVAISVAYINTAINVAAEADNNRVLVDVDYPERAR